MVAKRENSFKKYLIDIMGTRWDVQSHEDKYSEGIPDLSYGAHGVNGWVELKQIPKWPVRATTEARPSRYTPIQVNWLMKRDRKGGNCFVMVKVGIDDYFLFTAAMARRVAKGMTQAEYKDSCVKHWAKCVNPDELVSILSRLSVMSMTKNLSE